MAEFRQPTRKEQLTNKDFFDDVTEFQLFHLNTRCGELIDSVVNFAETSCNVVQYVQEILGNRFCMHTHENRTPHWTCTFWYSSNVQWPKTQKKTLLNLQKIKTWAASNISRQVCWWHLARHNHQIVFAFFLLLHFSFFLFWHVWFTKYESLHHRISCGHNEPIFEHTKFG